MVTKAKKLFKIMGLPSSLSLLFKLPFPGVKTIMIKMMMEFTFGKEDCWKIAHSEPNFRFHQ